MCASQNHVITRISLPQTKDGKRVKVLITSTSPSSLQDISFTHIFQGVLYSDECDYGFFVYIPSALAFFAFLIQLH